MFVIDVYVSLSYFYNIKLLFNPISIIHLHSYDIVHSKIITIHLCNIIGIQNVRDLTHYFNWWYYINLNIWRGVGFNEQELVIYYLWSLKLLATFYFTAVYLVFLLYVLQILVNLKIYKKWESSCLAFLLAQIVETISKIVNRYRYIGFIRYKRGIQAFVVKTK